MAEELLLKDFLRFQAQTSSHPLGLTVSHSYGSWIYDNKGKAYLDFVAGVSACSLGHRHPRVVNAIKKQLDTYLHVMVYGEFAQEPSATFSKLLASQLPSSLSVTYLTNSGTEAIEGAMKLAKRATGKTKFVAAQLAYHGNTQGSMSLMGYEERKQAFRPLIPGTSFISFNSEDEIHQIDDNTAAVVLETIQGGAGFIEPKNDYLKKVKQRCNQVGALLILDEIQPGFGRTGRLFAFEHFDIIPDILVSGKGMGGGMPVGAFTASEEVMKLLSDKPKLGHITTFGGHPVIAAACLATLSELLESDLIPQTLEKEKLFRKLLIHKAIREIRGRGLMLTVLLDTKELADAVILRCLQRGLVLFWLLFEPCAIRITPPLTISEDEIKTGCDILIETLNEMT